MKIKDLNGISEDALKNVKGLGKESYREVIEKAKTMGLRIYIVSGKLSLDHLAVTFNAFHHLLSSHLSSI